MTQALSVILEIVSGLIGFGALYLLFSNSTDRNYRGAASGGFQTEK
jgi:hypothetical protein